MTENLTTRQLLEQSGITREQLYSYVNAGLLRVAERTDKGRLRFAPSATERVRLIRELNESGYTLRDIRETFKTAFKHD